MSPSVALFVWFVLLVGLLWLDPAKDRGTSVALWIPVIWMFIIGTRLPSQWFGGQMGQAAQALEEGNPLDRTISSALILLAFGIMMSRSFKWDVFLVRNLSLTAFLGFALLSVLWSDYPFVAFKRWFRDLGNYLVMLVAVSDPNPLEAVRAILRRLCYLLIPLCILTIKYYPGISKQYDMWTGLASYSGVTTSKNMLGVVCLISGLFFFWDILTRWPGRKERRTRRILLVNIAFIAMTLWLLNMSDSATSRVCLVLGCLVIAAVHTKTARNHPALLKRLIPAGICAYVVLAFGFGFDISAEIARLVGRNPNLTDRTRIWLFLLGMNTNSLLGTGYESFWLGPRLQWFWRSAGLGRINEAHNGYLEIYLNLGLTGLTLLLGFLVTGYRTICEKLTTSKLASLAVGFWTVLLFYSVTEAGFRSGLMWLTFLLGTLTVSGHVRNQEQRLGKFSAVEETERRQLPPLEPVVPER
ncbi:MAG TPA: O-antigen ligase family protein [Bryobacteraceae bacterium]|nr:O-antigen ligase family protein [Bryobacteraceae bacterium]